jgi:hypothetical protein
MTIVDFTMPLGDDGILAIPLQAPIPIGGMPIQFEVEKYFGGTSGLIVKNVASGFNGASGITITNSGQGVMNIQIFGTDMSGLQYGAYPHTLINMTSGTRTTLAEGYLLLTPSA